MTIKSRNSEDPIPHGVMGCFSRIGVQHMALERAGGSRR